MDYNPRPIDTSGVKLPGSIRKLIESLAESNHDHWVLKRISEGWTYGHSRSDKKKTNPGIVPYSGLSESEKEYDRKTAVEALKSIIALGYKIEGSHPKSSSGNIANNINIFLRKLKEPESLKLCDLIQIWKFLSSNRWSGSSEIYEILSNTLLERGEPLIAYDVISVGFEYWPGNRRLNQLMGLALAESGATEKAKETLARIYKKGTLDGETIGILARTYKDVWAKSNDFNQLKEAHNLYKRGYNQARLSRGKKRLDNLLYTGINASSTALLMGRDRLAKTLAKEVREICIKKLKNGDDYWALSTLGEASLILRDWEVSEEWYCRAADIAKGNYRNLNSTRRQASILLEHLRDNVHRFDHCFNIPNVIVFSGHMIDQPGRHLPRFPQYLENEVRVKISDMLCKLNAGFGFSSAACGSDIIFLEEMLRRKAEINIVLPFPPEIFLKTSVDIIPRSNWGERFRRVLKRAVRVINTSEHSVSGAELAYHYSNLTMDGMAILKAGTLDTGLRQLAVWDRLAGDGVGGVVTMMKHWCSRSLNPEVIDLNKVIKKKSTIKTSTRATGKPVKRNELSGNTNLSGFSQKIVGLFYADVVRFSKLKEEDFPAYIEHFMGEVADLISTSFHKPLSKNVWGDAFFLTFPSVKDAGNYAINLSERISNINWERKGLPKEINLRISLHSGPAYYFKDPILRKNNYIGEHINRVARIEVITPPGQIYASQEFAALSAAQRVKNYECCYVGQILLPKDAGTFPLYHVSPKKH